MAKNNRPTIDNPLASMGLDEIVRGITSPANTTDTVKPDTDEKQKTVKKAGRPKRGSKTLFEENLAKYKGINEQGSAVWIPKEVKKKLEMIRVNAQQNIPLRALASAIIMTYISENEDVINNL